MNERKLDLLYIR